MVTWSHSPRPVKFPALGMHQKCFPFSLMHWSMDGTLSTEVMRRPFMILSFSLSLILRFARYLAAAVGELQTLRAKHLWRWEYWRLTWKISSCTFTQTVRHNLTKRKDKWPSSTTNARGKQLFRKCSYMFASCSWRSFNIILTLHPRSLYLQLCSTCSMRAPTKLLIMLAGMGCRQVGQSFTLSLQGRQMMCPDGQLGSGRFRGIWRHTGHSNWDLIFASWLARDGLLPMSDITTLELVWQFEFVVLSCTSSVKLNSEKFKKAYCKIC